jgi:hypothetical protein
MMELFLDFCWWMVLAAHTLQIYVQAVARVGRLDLHQSFCEGEPRQAKQNEAEGLEHMSS